MLQSQSVAASGDKRGRPLVRAALWLLLGGWFGGYLLFGAVIAPTAFSVLPTTQIAGTLVGPVLTKLHLFGVAAGIPIAVLSHLLGRHRWLVLAPLLLSVLCCYSHFGVSAELAEIRLVVFGPEGSPEIATRFGFLHRVSVGIFIAVGASITALIGLHARADARSVATAFRESATTTRGSGSFS
jgi:hypothetical protein